MSVKIKFLGATLGVTGSCYMLETEHSRILVDCGLFQERDLRYRNWERFPVSPRSIDAVILTHAHLDHCGLLPKLVREGFDGVFYSTPSTADITKVMLVDSARLQERDAQIKKERHKREKRKGPHPEVPLYSVEDAEDCFHLFKASPYEHKTRISEDIEFILHDAGHVLGGAMIEMSVKDGNKERRLLFSGDIGRCNRPILRDPTVFEYADYVIMESTYANRDVPPPEDMFDDLVEIIDSTVKNGGNIVIPSFALERAQELLYFICRALYEKKIPPVNIYLDSPMAISITDIFKNYYNVFDEEMKKLMRENKSIFDCPGLHMTRLTEESQNIENDKSSSIIIAGSGMVTGGRIKHHLVNNISDRKNTIMFVGYQANGTLGRIIVEGADRVRLYGEYYSVRARVEQLSGFSSHADSSQLQRWIFNLKNEPKKVFITHGEEESARYLADLIREKKGWDAVAPDYQQEFILD